MAEFDSSKFTDVNRVYFYSTPGVKTPWYMAGAHQYAFCAGDIIEWFIAREPDCDVESIKAAIDRDPNKPNRNKLAWRWITHYVNKLGQGLIDEHNRRNVA